MLKIAILGHRTGNIGHLFMAEGVENIVKEVFKNKKYDIIRYEQHNPLSIYNNFLKHVSLSSGSRLTNSIKNILNQDNISKFIWKKYSEHLNKIYVAIASGGPNVIKNPNSSVDMKLIFHHMHGAFYYNKVPVFNLSNGSCFSLENIPNELSENAKKFWKIALKYCKVTTVRDKIAEKLLESIGYRSSLIPCPGILSGLTFEKFKEKEKKYIIINYQEKGANEDWGCNVDKYKWKKIIQETINRLLKNHKVILLCHNDYEENIAKKLNIANVNIVYPKTLQEYGKIILSAKVGLVSRIHAAIALAGIGVPSVVIGTDTRLETVKLIGLRTIFVKDAKSDYLVSEVEDLINIVNTENVRLHDVREYARDSYVNLIENNLR